MANTIELKKYVDIIKEVTAAGTIKPGMLLERTSAGKVQAHSTAGGIAERVFAIEDALQGNDISDDYSADDLVRCSFFLPGEEANALLADGENASIGDLLESHGDGYLQVAVDSGGAEPVGVALEAVDMSGSSAADPDGRIRIEII